MPPDSYEADKSVKAKTCFVISPFDRRGDYFFDAFVRAVCKEAGFTPVRARPTTDE